MNRHSWTAHAARERFGAAVFGIVAVVATGAAIAFATGHAVAGVAGSTVLLFALRYFYFPTRFEVDERGVAARCLGPPTRLPWPRLRRFRYDDSGGFLSTRSRPSLLDSFTGLHLTWGVEKEEAVKLIERHMAAHRN